MNDSRRYYVVTYANWAAPEEEPLEPLAWDIEQACYYIAQEIANVFQVPMIVVNGMTGETGKPVLPNPKYLDWKEPWYERREDVGE